MHPDHVRLPDRKNRQSFALIATLSLLAVATILLVLFVSTTTLDRSASYSYSQSLKADQIGLGGLHLIVGQLQAEMYKDGMPDTNNSATSAAIFTNVSSFNILPQANVTNSSLPALIKMSTNALIFSGGTNSTVTAYQNGSLLASSISSTAPSLNGRSVSTNVWNQIYLGQYPNSASAPYWVVMTRNGPTNASGLNFGATGNTLNNPSPANTNYAVGRIAYAIYDEGSLLDINAAGYLNSGTASLSAAQIAQIKGTLAGADLTQIPGFVVPTTATSIPTFIQWRNANSAASASSYTNYVTTFASSNGFQQVYPGDSAFISRQDLIKAAQNANEGFTTNALPYLATFTRELNAPSWAPSVTMPTGTATKYKYPSNALILTGSPFSTAAGKQNPNPFVPFVRYLNAGTITGYNANGTTYTYSVSVGDSLVHRRFPLDRLTWITPKGPSALLSTTDPFYNAGGTVAAIQACFGLYWATAEDKYASAPSDTANWSGIKLWKYVGSTASLPAIESQVASATASPVETLSDVAKEASPREPNFFELLQAGVLAGSLGNNIGTGTGAYFQFMSNVDQTYPAYQLLRIGASIISQAQNSAYPINIEYNQQGFSFVASGVANLPYLSALKFAEGMDGATTGSAPASSTPMATYGLIQLWNPHQQSSASVTRPNVRVYVQGDVTLASGWASTYSPVASAANTYGATFTLAPNACYLQLANTSGTVAGVNGFLNPFAITTSDVATSTPAYSSGTTGWTSSTSALTYQSTGTTYADSSVTYEALRFPNVNLTLAQSGTGIPGENVGAIESTSLGQVHFSTILGDPTTTGTPATAAPMFQIILKYQDPNDATGMTYVPYDYWSGNNSSATWWNQFTMAGPTISPAYTGAGSSATVTGPPFTPMPTVDQTMHSTLVSGNLRYHSGTMMNPDPRVTRFSIFPMSGDDPTASTGNNGTMVNPMIDSIWSGSANTTVPFNVCGYGGAGSGPIAAPGLPHELNNVPAAFQNWFLPAYLCRNNTAYPNAVGSSAGTYFTSYIDPDGVQRIADSGLFPTPSGATSFAGTTGNPYYDPNDTATIGVGQRTGDRPIVLNRAFASVGELGYVCRDDPWRSLDFFSVFNGVSTSADSGLLDLFTVTDSPNTVVAGRVNLNTKNSVVLQAIFSGTPADLVGNTLTSATISNPSSLATALTNYTQATAPLVNKDQLVTAFNTQLPSGASPASPFETTDANEQDVKAFREGYIRALSDVGQTRTWNLLIDLVAQSGKYPPSATSLTQFEVDGARHYWLHVAIDRFTGKVIDRQLELIGP
jgi:hypothetical protein